MRNATLMLMIVALLLPLVAACGPEPTPTPLPSTEVAEVKPTEPPEPTDTPRPTETAKPTGTPTSAPTDTPEPTPTPVASFEKAPCPFELPADQVEGNTVECGYLVVPEDRADPDSPDIQLAVAIFRHPEGDPEPDPVIYLEGGPGGSALEFIGLSFGELSEAVFAANRDLIALDQRGVGLSEPALDCPEVLELGREVMDGERDGEEITDEEATVLMLEAIAACGEELSQVADLAAYNTAANAADVNALWVALGYDEVNLWGVSYGTHLALVVMRDHPEGVRSVVLDSVYPPDVDLYLEAPSNTDRAFDLLFDDCAADEACSTTYPDLRTVFFETVDQLSDAPASLQATDPFTGTSYDMLLTGDDLVGVLFQFLYYTDLVPSLPQIIYDASEGSFDLMARVLGLLIGMGEAVSRGMQFSVQCHEELAFSTLEQFEAELADYPELAEFFESSLLGSLIYPVCEDWHSGRAAAIENEPVTSDIPTLIMAGEYDPVTAPAWGRHAAETLENGYFFEYPAVGHGASVVPGCPREMMIAFLIDPSTAPDDSCISEMGSPQFVVPAEAGEIELEPFTNEAMGIRGVVPAGWTEISLGAYSRARSATDTAVLIAQAAPMSAEDLLDLLTAQLGLGETPEGIDEREVNGLTWTLYAIEVQGLSIDLALAESNGQGLLVMLQSEPGEHEILYEAVFLPVVDALVPIAQ
jgi:pimeloyl-ACP methyl ester carboxylesterase/predicted small lipoprotein YifL